MAFSIITDLCHMLRFHNDELLCAYINLRTPSAHFLCLFFNLSIYFQAFLSERQTVYPAKFYLTVTHNPHVYSCFWNHKTLIPVKALGVLWSDLACSSRCGRNFRFLWNLLILSFGIQNVRQEICIWRSLGESTLLSIFLCYRKIHL